MLAWQARLRLDPAPELLVDSLQRIGAAQRLPQRVRETKEREQLDEIRSGRSVGASNPVVDYSCRGYSM